MGPDQHPVYALEGSVAVAGAALSWLKNNLEIITDLSEVQTIAEQAKEIETGEVYFVPAFSGLFAPYWQQDARGYVLYMYVYSQRLNLLVRQNSN